MVYFKEDYATIYIDESFKIIHLEWHGLLQSHQYRETMNLVLNLIKDKKLTSFLANMKDMPRIQIQDATWREEVWFPQFIKTTIKKVAVVMSPDYFNGKSIIETVGAADKFSRITRRRFTNLEDATKWLKSENIFVSA